MEKLTDTQLDNIEHDRRNRERVDTINSKKKNSNLEFDRKNREKADKPAETKRNKNLEFDRSNREKAEESYNQRKNDNLEFDRRNREAVDQPANTAKNDNLEFDRRNREEADKRLQDSFPEPLTTAGLMNRTRQAARNAESTNAGTHKPSPLLMPPTGGKGKPKGAENQPNSPQTPEGQLNSERKSAKDEQDSDDKEQGRFGKAKEAYKAIKAAGGFKNAAQQLSQEGTRSLLRTMWIAVPKTFGISLTYVWTHYIGRYLKQSDFFSYFGTMIPKKGTIQRFFGEEFLEKRAAEIAAVAMFFILIGAFVTIGFPIYLFTRPDVAAKIGLGFMAKMIGL